MEEIKQSITVFPDFAYPIRHIPLKRLFDILFSMFVLMLGFPIFLFITLAIRLDSKGKVIYSHERIGRGGSSFRCYKFRTMYKDADSRLKSILNSSPDLQKEWEETRKLKND